MISIKQKIEKWIRETLGLPDVVLVHPSSTQNGDFTLIVSKNAEEYAEKLKECKISEIERIELVEPRFINIFLSKDFFAKSADEINEKGDQYGKSNLLEGEKTIIEYTNTNVLKPMHIGHLLGNVIGESLSRIIEWNGAEVKKNTYQGDVGLHIAKAVWGIIKSGGTIDADTSAKAKYIGEAYALGSNAYEDNAIAQDEIKNINKKIYERSDKDLIKAYEWGRAASRDHFEELYKKLGTKFDYYFFESEIADDSLKIVKEYLKAGLFEESEGAIVFRGEKFDSKLHTRVFVTQQGLPMYEAKDIAHAIRKYEKYKSSKSIIVTASEQSEYFKVVLRALYEINPEIANQTMHIAHGILKLSTGKMSSRKGNVITGENLIQDVEDLVQEKIKDRDFDDKEKENVAEVVAIGAIKYSILRQAIGGDIVFDFDKSISFEGDSGPYLQYSYTRARSVIEKAKNQGIKAKSEVPEGWNTTEVERLLYRFPEVVERASKEYSPHHLVTYLTELAGVFNSFYGNEKIIDDTGNDQSSPYKLSLTSATAHIMKNGLNLLGIKTLERM